MWPILGARARVLRRRPQDVQRRPIVWASAGLAWMSCNRGVLAGAAALHTRKTFKCKIQVGVHTPTRRLDIWRCWSSNSGSMQPRRRHGERICDGRRGRHRPCVRSRPFTKKAASVMKLGLKQACGAIKDSRCPSRTMSTAPIALKAARAVVTGSLTAANASDERLKDAIIVAETREQNFYGQFDLPRTEELHIERVKTQ